MHQIKITEKDLQNKTLYGVDPYNVQFVYPFYFLPKFNNKPLITIDCVNIALSNIIHN